MKTVVKKREFKSTKPGRNLGVDNPTGKRTGAKRTTKNSKAFGILKNRLVISSDCF